AVLHALTATPARGTEVALLVVANALATLLRFVLLRGWVFRTRAHPRTAGGGPTAPQGPEARGGAVPSALSQR
ncbi:MAG: hypothetical protein JWR66_2319, partial [Modestobacter sp.]|nr:hypothetical protein [Modestobacter sp.]